jgi:protein-S-isoprenylcysteine O-methyltransferase Ste14
MFWFREAAGLIGYTALFGVLLFAPAGTLDWPRAWVLLAVLFVSRLVGLVRTARSNRELLDERAKGPLRQGQPPADKVLLPAFMASYAALLPICAIDRFHLRPLPAPPSVVCFAGLALFAYGWWLIFRVLEVNAYAALVVRHQTERRQQLIDTGPYATVRHPMYAAMIPIMTGMCLWLGSWLGALLAAVPIAVLALRIRIEEALLGRALPEYADYAARVRYRLIPHVW